MATRNRIVQAYQAKLLANQAKQANPAEQAEQVNTMMPTDRIALCESKLAYKFNDALLCLQAINNTGADIQHQDQKVGSNQTLQLQGEIAIRAWFGKHWYEKKTSAPQDFFRRLEDILAPDKLGEKAVATLDMNCPIVDANAEKVGKATMEKTLKALCGAVKKDGGEGALDGVMQHLGFGEYRV
ncbi:hypothetical protein EJ04DRAFT_527933 [Polyplosphaeria fusca]|uniref:Uncharacterized protein n=1 Tax=Polyplosphaeria fusca TaxID=682080 RepID=A0A9P4UYJ6_9PLEO|nr:hypothetical protein EJ04DRAFT_527933 [Polyplosphaeria fusca]